MLGHPVIDTMMDLPFGDVKSTYEFMMPNLRDVESSEEFEFPAQYMFKDVPAAIEAGQDAVAHTVALMDHFGIESALIGWGSDNQRRAVEEHPDRFFPSVSADPNDLSGSLQLIRDTAEHHNLKAVSAFAAGTAPQVPLDDPAWYPIYQLCSDLGLPLFCCVGVPGPRAPMLAQKVELLDEICWQFPDLVIVMRHGAEPWEELAVKLMLKWPNLYYSTSAFAPKYYPQAIIDYANTRGADKVIYGGYFPMGLTLHRIFEELPHVGFKDDVWPKFLAENARRVLKLDAA